MVICIATAIGISRLRYKEMAIFRNGVLLPLYERPIINNTFFVGFMDLVFIVIAFSVSAFLTSNQLERVVFDKGFFSELALVCGIQLGVFYLGGLYKETYRQFGVGDFLKTLKIVILSVVFFWVIFALLYRSYHTLSLTLLTIDFYLLFSFVAGSRFSFHILHYLSKKNIPDWKKRVLVYGASAHGISIFQQILHQTYIPLQPVGFLDDNPQLEGKRINGYQVFGGHWKLERLINTLQISEIIICDDEMKTEILRRVQKIARSYGVIIRKARLQLDQIVTVESREKILHDQLNIFADSL
jgi:FlaA1/EpsC-like NDP-sugar epimerase